MNIRRVCIVYASRSQLAGALHRSLAMDDPNAPNEPHRSQASTFPIL
jgi:hypothetical protein